MTELDVGANPFRFPVGFMQVAHRPIGGITPMGREAVLVDDLDLPPNLLVG